MAGTHAKVTPQFNTCHNLFIGDFVSQMERKSKDNFEERSRKEKKQQRYKYKEIMFDEYWKRHAIIVMRERDGEKEK